MKCFWDATNSIVIYTSGTKLTATAHTSARTRRENIRLQRYEDEKV